VTAQISEMVQRTPTWYVMFVVQTTMCAAPPKTGEVLSHGVQDIVLLHSVEALQGLEHLGGGAPLGDGQRAHRCV